MHIHYGHVRVIHFCVYNQVSLQLLSPYESAFELDTVLQWIVDLLTAEFLHSAFVLLKLMAYFISQMKYDL